MHGMVNYLIMPLFAFANAGITLSGAEGAVAGPVTYAIVIGLVLGKSVGIYLFTWLAVRSRVTALPQGMNWQNVAGVSLLGGIGFTVSLSLPTCPSGRPTRSCSTRQSLACWSVPYWPACWATSCCGMSCQSKKVRQPGT